MAKCRVDVALVQRDVGGDIARVSGPRRATLRDLPGGPRGQPPGTGEVADVPHAAGSRAHAGDEEGMVLGCQVQGTLAHPADS